MKTCPVCALDVDDAFLFCPDDGAGLEAQTTVAESPTVKPDEDRAVVLYCPTCAAEYPLTFTVCPVHEAPLTKHRIPKLSDNGSESMRSAPAATSVLQFRQPQSQKRLTTLGLKRPEIESVRTASHPVNSIDEAEPTHDEASVELEAAPSIVAVPGGTGMFGYREDSIDGHEHGFERRGLRIVAIATMIALVVFGLIVLVTFVSNFSRRPARSSVQVASTAQRAPDPAPFVPTPQEAQNYQEKEAPPSPSTPATPQPERPFERTRVEKPLPTVQTPPKTSVTQPISKSPAPSTPAAVTPTRVSNPPAPPLPRGDSGGFDARLVRVRSRQTAAGFRYDLTFNMQEQAGRAAQWQRVLINTRSASGMNHSEAIPFSHRLGASGALTFTISVELTGRAQADWQGRIVCTTLGWDNKGAPLQASFGANVTP